MGQTLCKIPGLFQNFSKKLTNPRTFQDTFQIPGLSRTCGNPDLISDEMAEVDSVETEIEDNNDTDILDQEADEESSVFLGTVFLMVNDFPVSHTWHKQKYMDNFSFVCEL